MKLVELKLGIRSLNNDAREALLQQAVLYWLWTRHYFVKNSQNMFDMF